MPSAIWLLPCNGDRCLRCTLVMTSAAVLLLCACSGPANDWYDALCFYFRYSGDVRRRFAVNVLFKNPAIFSEYLLECPSTEVSGWYIPATEVTACTWYVVHTK